MPDYKIVSDYSSSHLEKTVLSHLKDEWQLAGGVSMVETDADEGMEHRSEGAIKAILYAQALVKK